MSSPTLPISGLHYLSILFVLITNLVPVAHSLSFNITRFHPESSNKILLDGDAKFSFGAIQLTTDFSYHVGRVVASEPLQLYDSCSGTTADFTTRFSFTYDIVDNWTDDGLAFFLAPVGYPIPPDSAGAYFGLVFPSLISSTTSGTFWNQFLMVEFDSYPNRARTEMWDPEEPHVGININSVASITYAPCDFISNSGKPATVVISYNATTKNLSVSWSYEDSSVPLTNSSISLIVDLKGFLPELVTVGISAATGQRSEGHAVNFWEFSSNLNAKNMNGKKANNMKLLVAVVVVAVSLFMLLVGTNMYWLVIKKKNDKHEEDQNESVLVNKDLERGALPRKFSYQELVTATNGFAEDRKLGRGGSGQVYKGMLNDIDRQVAVKRIFQEFDHSERVFINEVRIISRLIHRNLVQFIGWCHEEDEFLLVYEYMPNGCLDANLYGNRRTLPWELRYKIVLGLASAINYLHEEAEQCVLHRDIKSANILLDTDFSTKLGDFGVAKLVDPRMRPRTTGVVGTFGYLAPEYVIEGRASKESDMYSFGVVVLEIACGRRACQEGEYHVPLMRWVWELYLAGNILEAADERLEMKFDPNEMKRLLMVGLWCTRQKDQERPKAGQVIKALQLDSPLPELPQDMEWISNETDFLLPPMTSTAINSGR